MTAPDPTRQAHAQDSGGGLTERQAIARVWAVDGVAAVVAESGLLASLRIMHENGALNDGEFAALKGLAERLAENVAANLTATATGPGEDALRTKLAAVEALADEWLTTTQPPSGGGYRYGEFPSASKSHAGTALRAVLAGEPTAQPGGER